jgi:segregation and condensation protein A
MTTAADRVSDASTAAAAAIADWEDPPPGVRGDTAPVLAVDGFAGPLDWLLEMVRAKRIDLARLSIAALIEAFVDAMTAALAGRHAIRVENWAAWTVMAATLTELWSRLLLPADAPEARAAAEEAEALRRQLLERARMRVAAGWLERRPQLGHAVFARGMSMAMPSGRAGDVTELLRGCLVALRVPETHAAALRPAPPRLWQVTDAIARIQRLLDLLPDASPLSDFLPTPDGAEFDRSLRRRAAVASTLVAGLELARTGILALDQDAAWTAVRIGRRHDHRDAATAVPGPAA